MLATRSIKVLQTFNAELDDPVSRRIAARGTRICNSSAQGFAIAEYVFAQILSVLHPVVMQREQQTAKIWQATPYCEFSGSRWLVIGLGPIGQEVAQPSSLPSTKARSRQRSWTGSTRSHDPHRIHSGPIQRCG